MGGSWLSTDREACSAFVFWRRFKLRFEAAFLNPAFCVMRSAMLGDLRSPLGVLRSAIHDPRSSRVQRRFETRFEAQLESLRFMLDVLFMLAMRATSQRNKFVRYLQIDSSPQSGRDYLNIIECIAVKADLGRLLGLARKVQALCRRPLQEVKERVAELCSLQEQIARALRIHHLPTVLVGMGRASLAAKMEALTHAIRLESASHEAAAAHVQEIYSVTPDFGVESMLHDVEPTPIKSILPHWTDPADTPNDGNKQDDLTDSEAESADLLEYNRMQLHPGMARSIFWHLG